MAATGIVTWMLVFQLALVVKQSWCEFSFSSQNAFELTIPNKFPTSGDEVILKCRRKREVNSVTVGTSLLGSEDNVITWEENDRSVLTTNVNKRGGCTVIIDSRFTATYDSGRNRLSDTSCEYDGTEQTVKLKIDNWTPAHVGGDKWICLQFPFAESRPVPILSYVPVTSVSIQQDVDRFNNPSRGTIVTCISSPSRPAPHVFSFIKNQDGSEVKVTDQGDLKENVETDFSGLSVTTSSVLFSHDDDHLTNVFCKAFNKRRVRPILSDVMTVIVKYSPTVEILADPGASILEGTDVSLHCIAEGRPTPSVQWIWRGEDSGSTDTTDSNSMIISLDPILFLQTVTLKDSGKYECIASNGIGEDASTPIFLFVREKPDTSSEDRSNHDDASGQDDDGNDNQSSVSDSYSAAIIGTVITIIVVIIVGSIIGYCFVRRRWGKQRNNIIVGHRPRHSMDSNIDGSAIYATCSSMPGNSELPPYVDVLPPAYRLSNIANPGYDMVDNVINCIHHSTSPRSNGKRPLPSTPPSSDYGYAEIKESALEMEDSGRAYRNNTLSRRSMVSSNGNNNNNNNNNYINHGDSFYINSNSNSRSNSIANGSGGGTINRGIPTTNTTTTTTSDEKSRSNRNNKGNTYSNKNFDNDNDGNEINGNSYTNTSGGGSDGGGSCNSGGINGQINSTKRNDGYITTITTGDNGINSGGRSKSCRRQSMNGGAGDCGSGSGGSDGDDYDDGDSEFNNGDGSNSNNSDTLQIRSLRQEYCGYEVPILPPLEK